MASIADVLEAQELKQEFLAAVKFVGTKPGLNIGEDAQRRLYGLHCQATQGKSPAQKPQDLHEEQWKAWCEVGQLSSAAAMQEYIDLVTRCAPDFLTYDERDEEMPASEAPPAIQEQLKAAGLHQKSASDSASAADVFSAARSGANLAPFLPDSRDSVDADGLTPLIHAVDAEQVEAVNELLLASASVNIADPQGSTPLHYAALLGHAEIVDLLLGAGANPRLLDEEKATAADVARGEGHTELAEKLADAATSHRES
eukprot:TRINITY_DN39984_c0_g1_i1.p1 TRINITY_DN39984_c0_g1~~TRINITY_DN39984_c0_g1_i1.p1  ORF type:complete len:275 (+),score=45.69 TRINITY_DN39984_c0_g1_i1:56-826(+)